MKRDQLQLPESQLPVQNYSDLKEKVFLDYIHALRVTNVELELENKQLRDKIERLTEENVVNEEKYLEN